MPIKEVEKYRLGTVTDDGKFQEFDFNKPVELEDKPINTSTLSDEPDIFISGKVELKSKTSKSIAILKQLDRGGKCYIKTECVCDGTFYFASKLALVLIEIGCVCIDIGIETVKDANPSWMNCRFTATGIMWNTNNWRKMHGIPKISRKMCKKGQKHV